MVRPSIAALVLSLFLSAAPGHARERFDEYFECDIYDRGKFGLISMHFTADAKGRIEGKRPLSLLWKPWNGDAEQARFQATWARRGDGGFDLKDGLVSITPPAWVALDEMPHLLALELSDSPTQSIPPVTRAGKPILNVRWDEVMRKQSKVYLVARHRRGAVVENVEIDRSLFEAARPHLEAALFLAGEMARDPKAHCSYHEFVIVIG